MLVCSWALITFSVSVLLCYYYSPTILFFNFIIACFLCFSYRIICCCYSSFPHYFLRGFFTTVLLFLLILKCLLSLENSLSTFIRYRDKVAYTPPSQDPASGITLGMSLLLYMCHSLWNVEDGRKVSFWEHRWYRITHWCPLFETFIEFLDKRSYQSNISGDY